MAHSESPKTLDGHLDFLKKILLKENMKVLVIVRQHAIVSDCHVNIFYDLSIFV